MGIPVACIDVNQAAGEWVIIIYMSLLYLYNWIIGYSTSRIYRVFKVINLHFADVTLQAISFAFNLATEFQYRLQLFWNC